MKHGISHSNGYDTNSIRINSYDAMGNLWVSIYLWILRDIRNIYIYIHGTYIMYCSILTALSRFGLRLDMRAMAKIAPTKNVKFFCLSKKIPGFNLNSTKETVFKQVTVVRAAKIISEEWRLHSIRPHHTTSNPIFPIIGKSNSLDPWGQQICKPIWRAS